MARKHKLAAALFSLGCLHAGSLMALGLGEMELESFLNEPLNASVDLLNIGGLHADQIRIRLATTEDFDKLGLERAYFLTSLQFNVVADDDGRARIVITSEEPVLEPYLDFIVEARWPSGRLLREYTVLVDPPVFSQSQTVVSASQRVAEVDDIPAPSAEPSKKNEAAVGLFTERASEGEVYNSGTRVDVRDSDLAPDAMPQRNYNANTAPTPMPGSRYMISRDQTLWEIANQARPAGVSVHQTMLDIQRLNPDAFINGNINRIKAGYIIYLPSAEDISSADLPTALAEVREQNAAWREGRDAELYARSGPSLSISAESEEFAAEEAATTGATPTGADQVLADTLSAPAASTAPDGAETAPLEGLAAAERLAAVEEQLETMKRIVSLKDDQIAALQSALANAGVEDAGIMGGDSLVDEAASDTEEVELEVYEVDVVGAEEPLQETDYDTDGEAEPEEVAMTDEPAPAPAAEMEAAPEPVVKTPPAPPESVSDQGWTSYLWYLFGAVVLGVVGFLVVRRRGGEDEEFAVVQPARPVEDAFSDVQLKHQEIQVEAQENVEEPDDMDMPVRGERGYGERKHDGYATDVDAADALAEADIYIAYGRHQQAVDLLNNALAVEPGNPVYRLKLLEIYTELNDLAAANAQLAKLRDIGDADSITQAEALVAGASGKNDEATTASTGTRPARVDGPGLTPNPLAMMPESSEGLESDFSGLEIERARNDGELDLSSDFAGDVDTGDEEDLLIAADSNGLSTKLDLARAYLDMGDDDGARQILEEVIAEGNAELKAEARGLMDRIGS